MANALTLIRIICSLLILIFPAFSGLYYILYIIGGFTDAIDGTVARKLGTETPFGAKFDTIADFVFSLAVIIKIASAVSFPIWLLLWVGIIIAIKIANIAIGFAKHKTFVAVHSKMNKICGIVVYITPLFIGLNIKWQLKAIFIAFVCLFANVSAIDESIKILKYDSTNYRNQK